MSQDLLDDLSYLNQTQKEIVYVGFLPRLGASLIDMFAYILLLMVGATITSLFGLFMSKGLEAFLQIVMNFSFMFLYYPLFESSKYQATPGKQVLKLKIIGADGGRISYLRALGRFWSKFLSYTRWSSFLIRKIESSLQFCNL